MTYKLFLRGLLVGFLSLALAKPGRAESYDTAAKQIITGIVVVSVGVGALVTFLILRHKPKQSSVTGCIGSATNGLTVTDEKDNRAYALSGDVGSVKAGERMTLAGKRNSATLVFQVRHVSADVGACRH